MTEREEFEAWMRTGELDLTPDLERDGDVYEDWDTQRAWRGWQAARATAEQPEPKGWITQGGATFTLEAAAERGKTPQALAYAAVSRALGGIEKICRNHGYNYAEILHDWLEAKLSATPAACSDDTRTAFESAWSDAYNTGDFLLRHHTLTDQYANHDTQRAWEGWKLAHATPADHSAWFAVTSGAAASLEDAAACMQDPDAKRSAEGAAAFTRKRIKELLSALKSQQDAAIESHGNV